MYTAFIRTFEKIFLFIAGLWIISRACIEFLNISWGTGIWLGQFAPKWTLAFFLFTFFSVSCLMILYIALWFPQKLAPSLQRLSWLRDRLGYLRWIFAFLLAILPVYILQYTFWGIVLHGPSLRILLMGLCAILSGWLLTRASEGTFSWSAILTALVLVAGACAFFAPLARVTSYPFSLGWSEGNRLWDYSILFGRHLYDYPADKPIPVYLDIGRQFVGGIPFLIPGLTIWQARLWVALIDVIPYLILGWVAYKLPGKDILKWVLAGIWAFTFVRQGPIHPPLLLCAIVVAFAWGRPSWLAVPLIAAASFFAEVSRFTWLFAPGMWAAMLELGTRLAPTSQSDKETWRRSISVGLAGVFGGYLIPFVVPKIIRWVAEIGGQASSGSGGIGGVTLASVEASISSQPLLWYRLFPSDAHGIGILILLLFAVAPLIIILIYLARTNRWVLNLWQKLAIILPLLAFLVVGLIVSTKIGGGGDLHNMDMFIIGLMFAGAIAWRNGGHQWITSASVMPGWIRFIVLAAIALPAYGALINMIPISIQKDIDVVLTLADIVPANPRANPLPDVLPSEEETMQTLEVVRQEVLQSASAGEVLFADQRQLLTFGYIDIPLVPEYDKKVLIDQALGGNAQYFEGFYRDLAAQRFSMILINSLHNRIKTDTDSFSEENNAWVRWVSIPVLCYYEPVTLLKKVNVQLLVPRQDISDCAQVLP